MNNNALETWHREFVRTQYTGGVSYDTTVILAEIKHLVAESTTCNQTDKYRCVRRARRCLQYLQELANFARSNVPKESYMRIANIDMPTVRAGVQRIEMEHTRSLMPAE
jgi:hypothetical protein